MIDITFDAEKKLAKIRKALGPLSAKAPSVLASATTATAKEARKLLAAQANKTYAITNANFNKEMSIKNATTRTMTAVITSYGKAIDLIRFKTNPSKMPSEPPDVVKAKVLKQSTMKPLEKDGIKAFIVRYKSGHVAIAERTSKQRMPIKSLYAPGMPKMLGDEKRVYNVVKPHIMRTLDEQINIRIERLLQKAAKEASE